MRWERLRSRDRYAPYMQHTKLVKFESFDRAKFARSVSFSALCGEEERTETIYSELLSITADGWFTVGPVLAGNPVTDVTDGSRLETNDREY